MSDEDCTGHGNGGIHHQIREIRGHEAAAGSPSDARRAAHREELVALDAADAGVGDIVLVNNDGGAAQMIMGDTKLIASVTICGVIDSYSWQGQTVRCH